MKKNTKIINVHDFFFTLVAAQTVIWGVGNSPALDDMLIIAPRFLKVVTTW